MCVHPARIVFHLSSLDFFQQISNIFMIGQGHLNAHTVQSLHGGLSHTAANQHLAVFEIFEFCHVGGIASHAMSMMIMMMVMVVIMIMVVMIFARIWKFA